jgi:predicted Zn-dependent protease
MKTSREIVRRALRRLPGGLRAAALLVLAFVAPAARAEAQIGKVLDAAQKATKVAEKVESVLPIGTEEEVGIGRGVAATVAGYYKLDRDPALTDYVNMVGLTVAAANPRPDIRYRFGVLDTDQVNALSAPGGYIFVTRGALALMDDEAELAGVLGHEVGHVNEKHVVKEIQKRARTELGADVAQAALKTDAAALDKVVGLGTDILFVGLSREDELEADSLGTAYAAQAGYDPTGLLRFVQKLQTNESKPFMASLKATHPKPKDRIKLLERVTGKTPGAGGAPVVLADRYKSSTASVPR